MATTTGPSGSITSGLAGRPPAGPGPKRWDSDTAPAPPSAVTARPTVEAESAVRRARSARETGPWKRIARRTRAAGSSEARRSGRTGAGPVTRTP